MSEEPLLLRLYNTLTRNVDTFKARRRDNVQMYTCGPSIYRRPHIGNYRTFLFEDVLQRYLTYLGYDVDRLMTLTDVEDKAIVEATAKATTIEELTSKNAEMFFTEAKALRMETIDRLPRSSTTVDQAVELIQSLLKGEYAYWYDHEGRRNVYFDPLQFEDFGKLAHLDMSKWPEKKRRFHKDTYPGTPWNKGDFILWHGFKAGDTVFWDTAIGRGRPAWNIQDAAMVTKHFGFAIDIACGAVDNLVRHHDYTVAAIESVSDDEFAPYWVHGEHLVVDGKKMSKSKGNVYYPDDLLARGYGNEHIRFFLIYGHYRRRLNFTFENMKKTSRKLDKFRKMVSSLATATPTTSRANAAHLVDAILTSFEGKMNDDLDVAAAFDSLYAIISTLHMLRTRGQLSPQDGSNAVANLRKVDQVLQVIF